MCCIVMIVCVYGHMCVAACVFVAAFVFVHTSPHPNFHSTTQEKEDEAEELRSPNRNYY